MILYDTVARAGRRNYFGFEAKGISGPALNADMQGIYAALAVEACQHEMLDLDM